MVAIERYQLTETFPIKIAVEDTNLLKNGIPIIVGECAFVYRAIFETNNRLLQKEKKNKTLSLS